MKWQSLAFPCLVAATLAGCNGRPRTNETGAVPGSPADTASVPSPAATPAPTTTDSTMTDSASAPTMDSTSSR